MSLRISSRVGISGILFSAKGLTGSDFLVNTNIADGPDRRQRLCRAGQDRGVRGQDAQVVNAVKAHRRIQLGRSELGRQAVPEESRILVRMAKFGELGLEQRMITRNIHEA